MEIVVITLVSLIGGIYIGWTARQARTWYRAKRLADDYARDSAKLRHPTNVYRGVMSSDPERPDFMP
jgi:hypothetical protein